MEEMSVCGCFYFYCFHSEMSEVTEETITSITGGAAESLSVTHDAAEIRDELQPCKSGGHKSN